MATVAVMKKCEACFSCVTTEPTPGQQEDFLRNPGLFLFMVSALCFELWSVHPGFHHRVDNERKGRPSLCKALALDVLTILE